MGPAKSTTLEILYAFLEPLLDEPSLRTPMNHHGYCGSQKKVLSSVNRYFREEHSWADGIIMPLLQTTLNE